MRTTGKTFRAILTSLLAASEGKTVALIVRDDRLAERAFRQAVRILDGFVDVTTSCPARLISFPGGGRMYVCSLPRYVDRERWTGVTRPEPIYDTDPY